MNNKQEVKWKSVDFCEKRKLHFFSKLLIVVDVCAILCFFLAYGPWAYAREYLVTTALTTRTHRYLAYVLYSDNRVKAINDANATIESGEDTDASAIKFVDNTTDVYSSIYEEQILKKDEGNDDYKMFVIDEDKYKGYITVIYHPERLNLAISNRSYGSQITTFAKNTGALVAINGGGGLYSDEEGNWHVRTNIIVDGKIHKNNGKKGKLIGMNYDNVLCLMNSTAKDAIKAGMKWAVEFGPFLIVNGVPATFTGNGGYGVHPRTAIGQRQDGIVILVTIDGRGGNGSAGISLPDLTEIFVRYNCYNAANLDGGGSTMLAIEGKLINNPTGWDYEGERYVYDAIILTKPTE